MATLTPFRLKVVGSSDKPVMLELAAASAHEAVRRATQLGYVVLSVDAATASAGTPAPRIRRRDFSLLLFNQELLTLLEAGLNLNEALATLLAKERNASVVALLRAIADALAQGRNFSDVLADHPQRFPEVYVAIVRASERTGDLPRALARYIGYQRQFDEVRKKLVSVCIYPAMLMLVGGGVTLFLLAYVVPRFADVYLSAGREMPAASLALLTLGRAIGNNGLLLSLLAALGGAVLLWWLLRRGGAARAAGLMLQLPGIAVQVQAFQLARLYRALGLLLSAGIAVPRALSMAAGLLGPTQRPRLAAVRVWVEQGRPLSDALQLEGLASPVAQSLLTVGERSGQLADMLERSARFHDEALERWLDWASRLLEPLLMTLIGIVIGGVVLLMYLPIFELAGNF